MSRWKKFYYISCAIGSLAVSFAGIFLSAQFFISKDKRVEIIQATLKDKRELFMEASSILNSRFFDHSRVIWTIENIKTKQEITENLIYNLKDRDEKYKDTLRKYNIEVRKISKQLAYVFDDKISKDFSVENDNSKNPISISGKFIKLHKKTQKLILDIFNRRDIDYEKHIQEIEKERRELQKKIIKFLEDTAMLTFDKNKMLYDLNMDNI